MTDFEKFYEDFKETVVNTAYDCFPKDYRQSDEYQELSLDQKFGLALNNGRIRQILESVMYSYYEEIQDLKEETGCCY